MRVFYFGILVSLLSLPQSMQLILVEENCVNGYVHQVFYHPSRGIPKPTAPVGSGDRYRQMLTGTGSISRCR